MRNDCKLEVCPYQYTVQCKDCVHHIDRNMTPREATNIWGVNVKVIRNCRILNVPIEAHSCTINNINSNTGICDITINGGKYDGAIIRDCGGAECLFKKPSRSNKYLDSLYEKIGLKELMK